MNILLTGQCSLHLGRMEYGNIGNYQIIEPFIRQLHSVFPHAKIKTTFQMTDKFCHREKVTRLPLAAYYTWELTDLPIAVLELLSALIHKYLRFFIYQSLYIKAVINSDLIIDYSGDMWGDNAYLVGKNRFLIGFVKNYTSYLLGKPSTMIAGSIGPIKNPLYRFLAKFVFQKFHLVTTREPLSIKLIKQYGFRLQNVKSLTCPAFLFQKAPESKMEKIYTKENLIKIQEPIAGFVLCGWNFPIGPYNRNPRADSEYAMFAQAIEFMENELGLKVYLLSHSNGFQATPRIKLTHGRDFFEIKRLERVLKKRGKTSKVSIIKGIYAPAETKAIIGKFDMLVSGRLHAAVSAFSQHVPTVIMDYGHEPKAHKLRGFAMTLGMESYVADPALPKDLEKTIKKCWHNKKAITNHLEKNIPKVQELAQANFQLLAQTMSNLNTKLDSLL